jgi:hypothetical protein
MRKNVVDKQDLDPKTAQDALAIIEQALDTLLFGGTWDVSAQTTQDALDTLLASNDALNIEQDHQDHAQNLPSSVLESQAYNLAITLDAIKTAQDAQDAIKQAQDAIKQAQDALLTAQTTSAYKLHTACVMVANLRAPFYGQAQTQASIEQALDKLEHAFNAQDQDALDAIQSAKTILEQALDALLFGGA